MEGVQDKVSEECSIENNNKQISDESNPHDSDASERREASSENHDMEHDDTKEKLQTEQESTSARSNLGEESATEKASQRPIEFEESKKSGPGPDNDSMSQHERGVETEVVSASSGESLPTPGEASDRHEDANVLSQQDSNKAGLSSGGNEVLQTTSDLEGDQKISTAATAKSSKEDASVDEGVSVQCIDSEDQFRSEQEEPDKLPEPQEAKEDLTDNQICDPQEDMEVERRSELESEKSVGKEDIIKSKDHGDKESMKSQVFQEASDVSGLVADETPSGKVQGSSTKNAIPEEHDENAEKSKFQPSADSKAAVDSVSVPEKSEKLKGPKDDGYTQDSKDLEMTETSFEDGEKTNSQQDQVQPGKTSTFSTDVPIIEGTESSSQLEQATPMNDSQGSKAEVLDKMAEDVPKNSTEVQPVQEQKLSGNIGSLLSDETVEPMEVDNGKSKDSSAKNECSNQNNGEPEQKESRADRSDGAQKSGDQGEPMECDVIQSQALDLVDKAQSSIESRVNQNSKTDEHKDEIKVKGSEQSSGSLQSALDDSNTKPENAPEFKSTDVGAASSASSEKDSVKFSVSESINVETESINVNVTASVSPKESKLEANAPSRTATISSVSSQVPSSVIAPVSQLPSLPHAAVLPVSSPNTIALPSATKQPSSSGSSPQLEIKKGTIQQQATPSFVPNQTASKAHLAAKLKNRPQQCYLQLGGLTVKRLGVIVWDRPAYHTKRFLFPVGFVSERLYASYRQPGQSTCYTCEILDGGERPNFRISVQDDTENPITAKSPTEAWKVVEQRVQALPTSHLDQQRLPSGTRLCGAVYFGLAHPSVIRLLQGLAGANKCATFSFARKREQLHEVVEEENAVPVPESTSSRSSPAFKESQTVVRISAQTESVPVIEKKMEVERDDWLPQLQQELNDMKNRTRHTIQPLSYSQLQPEGWTAQEMSVGGCHICCHPLWNSFFRSCPICRNPDFASTDSTFPKMSHLAGAIGTKTAQQVHEYAFYVCDVMDRRVKASREEQLQKQAALLAAAHQSSNAQDAGAAALQAAVTAAASAPKEGTQLREMLKSQASHGTLAQVLTHLWHTERLWRHALQQALQLFNETHMLSDKMMEKLLVVGARLKSGKGFSEASLKKRVEEETKRLKTESLEKQRKQVELEKQLKKAQMDSKKLRDDLSASEENVASLNKNLRDFEGLRDQALTQMSECRGKLLKEQKARHALMLRKERLEAEVIRLRCAIEADGRSRRAQECKAEAQNSRMEELREELRQERTKREALEKQVEKLGHQPNYDGVEVEGVGEKRRRSDGEPETGRGSSQSEQGGGDRCRLAKMASIAVPGWKRQHDGSWSEEKKGKTTPA
eukprot:755143-Hanusia_phi.AAC.2